MNKGITIHCYLNIEPMAWKYFKNKFGPETGKYFAWEFMHTYRNLLVRLVVESDFVRGKKPVYDPIINRTIYRDQHKIEVEAWENWQSLFFGEWKNDEWKIFSGCEIHECIKRSNLQFNPLNPELIAMNYPEIVKYEE